MSASSPAGAGGAASIRHRAAAARGRGRRGRRAAGRVHADAPCAAGCITAMKVDDRNVGGGRDEAVPSVETTMRFFALCERYGSDEAAVAAIVRGRRAGVAGLPVRDGMAGVERDRDACGRRVPRGGRGRCERVRNSARPRRVYEAAVARAAVDSDGSVGGAERSSRGGSGVGDGHRERPVADRRSSSGDASRAAADTVVPRSST